MSGHEKLVSWCHWEQLRERNAEALCALPSSIIGTISSTLTRCGRILPTRRLNARTSQAHDPNLRSPGRADALDAASCRSMVFRSSTTPNTEPPLPNEDVLRGRETLRPIVETSGFAGSSAAVVHQERRNPLCQSVLSHPSPEAWGDTITLS